ncbi:hypothetical protein C2G38_2136931 [Gigaspora rosea]|uniref:Uncharacterized protein n=1 Tax=Gigaspora rosea TaxID=44941 RepID=A0A397W3H2_9GLOM|nr:hypothetical protein C2G38_2136931 [Gigaspora rosea]
MIFEKLFQKYRKTEPKSLFVFKNFVLMLLLFALLGYIWLIIWGIYNDNPVIQHSLAEETSIPAPAAYFFVSQATNISCHFVNVSGTHDCKQYITLLYINNTDYGVLYTSFFMMEDLKFSTISNNGISSLEFKLYLNDTSYNLSDNYTLPTVTFSMDDADFMKSYDRNLILSTQLSTYSKLLETILRLNQYSPAAFNVINSLGLIGGAWGFATAIYAVLFGTNAIKPWGLIQKYGFKINNSVQTKLRNSFEIIPLVHYSNTTNNLKKHELKKRLDSLQQFLTENVVDIQYLKEIYKKNYKK